MKRLFIFFLFVLTIFSGKMITACTEPIDLRNDGMEPMLVITCILTDTIVEFGQIFVNENQVVIVKTTNYFSIEYPQLVEGAKVWINSELLKMVSPGIYASEACFLGVPGETYKLEVHYDTDDNGLDKVYTATTTIPPKYHLDSISIVPRTTSRDFAAYLVAHFSDSLGHAYVGTKFSNENEEGFYSDRILRYGLYNLNTFSNEGKYRKIPLYNFYLRHEMNYDTGSKYYIYAGDTLSVQLEALSQEYYQFLDDAQTELRQNNPLFSGPRTNVCTNITGGALGVFGSYTFSRAVVQVPINTPELPTRP